MRLQAIDKADLWDQNLAAVSGAQFTSAWQWGEIFAATSRWAVLDDDGSWLAALWLSRQSLPGRLTYIYTARGPWLAPALSEQPEKLAAVWRLLAQQVRHHCPQAIFWRLEPLAKSFLPDQSLGSCLTSTALQPKQTLLWDLSLSTEKLLANCQAKTRYNIRLAQRQGVAIRPAGEQDWPAIWRLLQATARRDGFRLHPAEHYRPFLAKSTLLKTFVAEHDHKIIAVVLSAWFGDTVTYVHGCSDYEARAVMAPYLLHWHLGRLAAASGYLVYDFYGVDAERWPGVTRFKQGFGGQVKNYPGTFDLIFQPQLYGLYQFIRGWGRAWRRLLK